MYKNYYWFLEEKFGKEKKGEKSKKTSDSNDAPMKLIMDLSDLLSSVMTEV